MFYLQHKIEAAKKVKQVIHLLCSTVQHMGSKGLTVMIKTVFPGTYLTVNYGDEIWFKCACDSCWVDHNDDEH
jgi:hypothetical protein